MFLWVTVAIGASQSIARAANIDPVDKFAYGENVGWITLSSAGPVPFGVRTSWRFLVAPALGGAALIVVIALLTLTARRALRRLGAAGPA